MNEKPNRSFIVDFGCCIPFGHNLQCVNLYMQQERRRARQAIGLVGKRIKGGIDSQEEGLDCCLPTLYRNLLVDAEKNRIKRQALMMEQRVLQLFGKFTPLHLITNLAVKRLLRRYQISSDDHIVLPSADYFGTRALLKQLKKLPKEAQPSLHIRFIGVLEFTHSRFYNSLLELVSLIENFEGRIKVTAEVPAYTRYLNTIMRRVTVHSEPYPVEIPKVRHAKTPERIPPELRVLLPGSNRVDKGYYDLYNIAKETFYQFPKVRFVIQDMKRWDRNFNRTYRSKLASLPNVELVDAILSRDRIEALYNNADLILLPYDPGVYVLRGSAIHYEALLNRIPVLARKGCGFIEEINAWGSGWTYETKQELFDHLNTVLHTSKNDLAEKLDQAVINFRKQTSEATHSHLPL